MNNLWKPAALAAYCNQGRSGSTLLDSGALSRNASLAKEGSWSQITGHNNRWAIDLDGTQYGNIATTTGGLIYSTTLTITAWVAPASYSLTQAICGNRGSSSANSGFLFRLGSSGNIELVSFIGITRSATIPGSPVAGDWHHVAMRHSASHTSLWWDGVAVYTISNNTFPTPALGLTEPLGLWNAEIGAASIAWAAPLTGKGADLCLWGDALTDDEIKWLANPKHNVLQAPTGQGGFPLSRLVN